LPPPHVGSFAAFVRVIMTENMQHTVDDESRNFLTHWSVSGHRIVATDVGTDVHVADNRILRRRASEAKRDDVGGA
jgi:hypothetical protein